MHISERIRKANGVEAINVAVDVHELDVTAMGDRVPRYIAGAPVYTITMGAWADFVAGVQAICPDITETQLRELLRSRSAAIANAVTA